MNNFDLYIIAFFYTVTTITTVGYGDVYSHTSTERILSTVMMLLGVISFSFLTGSLTSILTNIDATNAGLKQRIATLNEIKKVYGINNRLFVELKKALNYDHNKYLLNNY